MSHTLLRSEGDSGPQTPTSTPLTTVTSRCKRTGRHINLHSPTPVASQKHKRQLVSFPAGKQTHTFGQTKPEAEAVVEKPDGLCFYSENQENEAANTQNVETQTHSVL